MALGRVRTYNPREVSIVVCGIPIDGGYASGEFLRITALGDWFTEEMGTDGEVTRTDTGENRYTLVLTLMQSNPLNALLSALLAADRNTPNGAGVAPTLVKDRSGTSLFTAPSCWITGPPEQVYSNQAEARAWTIRAVAGNAPNIVGGN